MATCADPAVRAVGQLLEYISPGFQKMPSLFSFSPLPSTTSVKTEEMHMLSSCLCVNDVRKGSLESKA